MDEQPDWLQDYDWRQVDFRFKNLRGQMAGVFELAFGFGASLADVEAACRGDLDMIAVARDTFARWVPARQVARS